MCANLLQESASSRKKPEEPEEVVRLRKAYNDTLRWSGFVLSEDPLFIPISWSDGAQSRLIPPPRADQ